MTDKRNRIGTPFLGLAHKSGLDRMITGSQSDTAAVRTLRCRTVAQGHLRQVNHIRDLPPQPMTADRSEDPLADAAVPNASEALLAALGSCLSIRLHANALVRGIPVRSLELDVEADIDMTAIPGTDDHHPKAIGFESIRVSVRMEADAPRETLASLVRHTVLWSPVANTLHNPVHLDVSLAPRVTNG